MHIGYTQETLDRLTAQLYSNLTSWQRDRSSNAIAKFWNVFQTQLDQVVKAFRFRYALAFGPDAFSQGNVSCRSLRVMARNIEPSR